MAIFKIPWSRYLISKKMYFNPIKKRIWFLMKNWLQFKTFVLVNRLLDKTHWWASSFQFEICLHNWFNPYWFACFTSKNTRRTTQAKLRTKMQCISPATDKGIRPYELRSGHLNSFSDSILPLFPNQFCRSQRVPPGAMSRKPIPLFAAGSHYALIYFIKSCGFLSNPWA